MVQRSKGFAFAQSPSTECLAPGDFGKSSYSKTCGKANDYEVLGPIGLMLRWFSGHSSCLGFAYAWLFWLPTDVLNPKNLKPPTDPKKRKWLLFKQLRVQGKQTL